MAHDVSTPDILNSLLAIMLLDLKWLVNLPHFKIIRARYTDVIDVVPNAALSLEITDDLFDSLCVVISIENNKKSSSEE